LAKLTLTAFFTPGLFMMIAGDSPWKLWPEDLLRLKSFFG